MPLRVLDITSRIELEGKYVGFPTTFVHLARLKDKHIRKKAVATIISDISKMRNTHVCFVGENPLEQEEIMAIVYELAEKGYSTVIADNNDYILHDTRYNRTFSYRINVYCPSSGKVEDNLYSNLRELSQRDEVKFVIRDIDDYTFAKDIIKRHPTNAGITFVPDIKGDVLGKELMNWIFEDKPYRVRLGFPIANII